MEKKKSNDWLIDLAQVEERPFASQSPLIGRLIVWLRHVWLNAAARAYLRPLRQRQNQFNRQMLTQLTRHDEWLVHQDQALSQNRRALGRLRQTLSQKQPALPDGE